MTRTTVLAFAASLIAPCLAASVALAAPQGPKGPKAGECQAPDVLVCHMDRSKEKPVCVPAAELGNHIGNHAGDYVADADGDGFTALGACAGSADDCRDDDPTIRPGAVETCNGDDDDCDGVVDGGDPGGGLACATGIPGVCAPGTTACTGGTVVCAPTDSPSPEICDGLDNDCDGAVDQGDPGGGFGCASGVPGVCAAGTTACTGGTVVCAPTESPSPEICDGLDNDCDGAIDDGDPDGGLECTTGLPDACAAGTTVCVGGTIECEPSGPLSNEVCDGADNDCDGIVDYVDLGATVLDSCTSLEWEKKASGTEAADLHAVGNGYSWAGRCTHPNENLFDNAPCQPNSAAAATCAAATGSANGCGMCGSGQGTCDTTFNGGLTTVWDWVNQLNTAAFAGHTDWRLPTSAGLPGDLTGDAAELESIADASAGLCGGGSGACIDPVFGPTATQDYWSASTVPSLSTSAFHVHFRFADVNTTEKTAGFRIRAVRSAAP